MQETKKSIKYNYTVDVNSHVLFIIYISHVYRLDLEMLLLLYDKIGEDVFYIFFMFAGKSFIMPKHTKMIKIRNFANDVSESLKTGEEVDYKTQQEKSFYSFIKSVYNEKTDKISIDFEIPIHNESSNE